MDELSTLASTARALHDAAARADGEVVAVICGGETGVKVADALSEPWR